MGVIRVQEDQNVAIHERYTRADTLLQQILDLLVRPVLVHLRVAKHRDPEVLTDLVWLVFGLFGRFGSQRVRVCRLDVGRSCWSVLVAD